MSNLVSVVVPAYNRAKRITPTLLSIVAQDYENMEIIVVDDGSSDDTGDVAESVLKSSARDFKIIRLESNMGVSVARNTGLDAASGDYVIFFDSDDLAEPDFISALVAAITEKDSDAASCGFIYRSEITREERARPILLKGLKHSTEELIMRYIFKQITLSVCTTIFKKSFLEKENLKFTEGCRFFEDYEFVTKVFSRCESINFSAGCHYICIHHEGSTTVTSPRTPEGLLRRYEHSAKAIYRTAQYVAEHARSPKIRKIGRDFMLADGLIKIMNIALRQRDKARFYRILRDPETRHALTASLRYFLRDQELFMMALLLLTAPWLYFWMRSRT